jgi:hypothetical protein
MYEELVQTYRKVHQGTCMKAQLRVENQLVSTPTSAHIQTKHCATAIRKYSATLTSNTKFIYYTREFSKSHLTSQITIRQLCEGQRVIRPSACCTCLSVPLKWDKRPNDPQ